MSKNTSYTPAYFIKKLSAIPAKLWRTGDLEDNGYGARCVLGHLGAELSYPLNSERDEESLELKAFRALWSNGHPADINDVGVLNGKQVYKQKTPKGRILAALRDLVKS